ncbi:TRAM LAG1 and CLN8 (TLC) lipid-sensing domain containing protein [Euphorbia peplus]|nr:TRAM LAG1 and CLN8 (TLC) lipid-sensing domain containing protein [Euphorbia peplus]
MDLPSHDPSVSATVTPTWLAPVLSGIVMCIIVYKLTGFLSILCFQEYGKLSKAKKIEWNNRGFSTLHALIVASASFYLLLISSLFKEDSQDELIVNRNSVFSNSLLGFSIGYFLSDLAMIFWYFPALGGLEYVLHHGLSMYSIILALLSGQAQIYILMVLFTESTTPFINLRWYLDVAGQKSSFMYVCNGVLLFLGWLVARIILFIIFFTHIFINFDQVKKIFPLGFYSILTVPPMLAVLNVIWFGKIARGLIKTLSKAKQHKQ